MNIFSTILYQSSWFGILQFWWLFFMQEKNWFITYRFSLCTNNQTSESPNLREVTALWEKTVKGEIVKEKALLGCQKTWDNWRMSYSEWDTSKAPTVGWILPVDQGTFNNFAIAFVDSEEGSEDTADARLDAKLQNLLYFSFLSILPVLPLQGAD